MAKPLSIITKNFEIRMTLEIFSASHFITVNYTFLYYCDIAIICWLSSETCSRFVFIVKVLKSIIIITGNADDMAIKSIILYNKILNISKATSLVTGGGDLVTSAALRWRISLEKEKPLKTNVGRHTTLCFFDFPSNYTFFRKFQFFFFEYED